jgi:NADP-dependent 3-hydroxy acid dehydrogenase YdfG
MATTGLQQQRRTDGMSEQMSRVSSLLGVINAGSSSLKFAVYDHDTFVLSGQVDGIGVHPGIRVIDPHGEAIEAPDIAHASKWGHLDILIHSIAFAPKEALQGRVTDCPRDGSLTAMDVSCWSFLDMAHRAEPLMREGGTMITMSYLGANEVVDNYGVMGPVKAALESAVRYVATEPGPKGIRAHAISPGLLATRAASGIREFDGLMQRVASRAPVRRLVTIDEVGAACVFLTSPYAAAMTGDQNAPAPVAPASGDHRFSHESWRQWPYNLLAQSFLLTEDWWREAAAGIEGVDRRLLRGRGADGSRKAHRRRECR